MTLIIDKVLYYGPNENVIEYGTSVLNSYNKWRDLFFVVIHTDTNNIWQKKLQKDSLYIFKDNLTPQEILNCEA